MKPTNGQSVVGVLSWILVVAGTYVILVALLAGPHFFGHKIKSGELAERDMLAPAKLVIVDEEKTREAQQKLRQDLTPVMKKNAVIDKDIYAKCKKLLDFASSIQRARILPLSVPPNLSSDQQAYLIQASENEWQAFRQELTLGKKGGSLPAASGEHSLPFSMVKSLPSARLANWLSDVDGRRKKYRAISPVNADRDMELVALSVAAAVNPQQWAVFQSTTQSSLLRFLDNIGLYAHAERKQWQSAIFEFLPDQLNLGLRQRTALLFASQCVSDMEIDRNATERENRRLVSSTKPIMKEIEVGTVVVHKGKRITDDDVKTLQSLGVTEVQELNLAFGLMIALLAAYVLFGVFLYTYEPKVLFSPSSISLMGTVVIITCAVALFVGDQYPQFVPLPTASLIFAVIYGKRIATFLAVLMIVFLSASEVMLAPYLIALSMASIAALGANIAKRKNLMFTGFLIGLVQVLGYSAAIGLMGTGSTINLGRELSLQMLGGLSSAIVAIGSLPFLENIFGILTPYRIAELSEPDQPLMRQLEENAPGTYQHSLAVANLAEGGARAIGADVNLVRTGAMYHDIGKMVTPRYFIENQLGDKNPHDFIPPEESRAKVLAHVTNGLALAQKYALPKAVQAFIPEHQGTTIMAYFYHKACLRDGAENVDPKYYRYPGPKPQTKETAIVMLADVSEAVTHSMRDPSQEEVETAISSVFKARWEDGQFSESGLTADELDKVKKGFVRIWRTLHHDRLKYPATTTGRMPVPPQLEPSESAVQKVVLPDEEKPGHEADPEIGSGGCC